MDKTFDWVAFMNIKGIENFDNKKPLSWYSDTSGVAGKYRAGNGIHEQQGKVAFRVS